MHVFISYRRGADDTRPLLIKTHLEARQVGTVFMDTTSIPGGADFVEKIDKELDRADAVVVVIGPDWAKTLKEREHGDDWVRHEVSTALRMRRRRWGGLWRGRMKVVPVLVDGATAMPGPGLPAGLDSLRRLNAITLRRDNRELDDIVAAVRGITYRVEAFIRRLRARARGWAVAAGCVAFLAGWTSLPDVLGLETRADTLTLWLAGRMFGAGTEPAQVVLIGIDADSESQVGTPFGPPWRRSHALLIDRVADAGARALAFDLSFEEPDPGDAALERALQAAAGRLPVLFGFSRLRDGRPDLLGRFARHARAGLICASQIEGRVVSFPLATRRADATTGGEELRLPSLALAAFSGGGAVEAFDAAALTVTVRLEQERRSPALPFHALETIAAAQPGCPALQPGDQVARMRVNPVAVPPLRSAPRRIKYEQVLARQPEALAALKGRIALVGLQKPGLDEVSFGFGSGTRWGAELIAAQVESLAAGRTIRSLSALAQWLLASAVAIGSATLWVALHGREPVWRWLVLGAAAMACALGAAACLHSELRLVSLTTLLGALLLGALGAHLAARGSSA